MKISEDTRAHMQILLRDYPWARYVSRSRGVLSLNERIPDVTDKGFAPTGRCVELPPKLVPEVPEGVMVRIETLLEVNDD